MSGQWWENDLIVGPFTDLPAANAWAAANPSSLFNGLLATAGGVQITWRGAAGWVGQFNVSSLSTAQRRAKMSKISESSGCSQNSRASLLSSTEGSELWNDLSAWSLGGQPPRVSGNKLIGASNPGSANWISKSIGSTRRFRTTFTTKSLAGGHTFVGLGGIQSPEGLSGCFGLAISFGDVFRVADGSLSDSVTGFIQANSTYYVDTVINKTSASITINTANDSAGITYVFSTVSLSRIVLFNSCPSGASGNAIGQVDFKSGISPMLSGVVPNVRTRHHSDSDLAWGGAILHTPDNFSINTSYDLVVLFHGRDSSEYTWSNFPVTDSRYLAILNGFLDAGYVCLSVSGQNKKSWGNNSSVDAYFYAREWVKQYVDVRYTFAFANSMGGIEFLNSVIQNGISPIGAVLTSASASLQSVYKTPEYASDINIAYNILGDYSVKTTDHDPMLVSPSLFDGIAFHWISAIDDIAINPNDNAIAMNDRLTASGIYSSIELTTGGHEFPYATPAMIAKYVAFYNGLH